MADAALNTVGCPACRRRFVWKETLSGKKVKCTCGEVFIIPAGPEDLSLREAPNPVHAAPALIKQSDFEALPAEDSPASMIACPSCNLPMKPLAAVCLNCGYDRRANEKVETRIVDLDEEVAPLPVDVAPPAPQLSPDFTPTMDRSPRATPKVSRSEVAAALVSREDDAVASKFKDLHLPLIFIVLGLGIMFYTRHYLQMSIGENLGSITIYVIFMVPMLLLALFATARLWDMSFGPLTTGLFKLSALAVGPMALADLIIAIVAFATMGVGLILGWFIRFVIVGSALAYLFDLDLDEVFITLIIIMFLRFLAEWVLPMVISAFS